MGKDIYKYEKYISNNTETRWASDDEIKAETLKLDLSMKCCESAGIPLISDGKTAYVDEQDSHTLVLGSTGAKKTRLLSMPLTNICIRAGESFVVMDPKGEIFDRTSGAADQYGYKIVVLNLRELEKGDCWNPLSIPYQLFQAGKQDDAINMLQDFIQILSYEKTDLKDPFWSTMAQNYILANMIFLLKYGKKDEVNLANIGKMSSFEEVSTLQKFIQWLDEDSIEKLNYSTVLKAPSRTQGGIISYAYFLVSMFSTQNKLKNKLGCDTFDIRDFATQKTAVYLIVPDEKTTYHFLGSFFVKQVYETMINQAQKYSNKKLPIRLNFILDEFCNFPKIPDMPSMITAARSRNIRFFLFAQGERQIVAKYQNDASTIKGNCDNWIFMNSRELELLTEISDLCGSYHEEGGMIRPLISVSQLQRLRKQEGEVLILYHRNYPFISYLADIDDYIAFEKIKPKDMQKNSYECQMINVEAIYEELPGVIKQRKEQQEKRERTLRAIREYKEKEQSGTKKIYLRNGFNRIAGRNKYYDDDGDCYDDDDYYEDSLDDSGKEKKSVMDKFLDIMKEKNNRVAELYSDDSDDTDDTEDSAGAADEKVIMDKKSEHVKLKNEEE